MADEQTATPIPAPADQTPAQPAAPITINTEPSAPPSSDSTLLHLKPETVQSLQTLGYSGQDISHLNIHDVYNIVTNKIKAPEAGIEPDVRPWYKKLGQQAESWWTTHPAYSGTLGAPGKSPEEKAAEFGKGVMIGSAPALVVSGLEAPLTTAASVLTGLAGQEVGGAAGKKIGEKVGAPRLGEAVGQTLGAVAGGMAPSKAVAEATRIRETGLAAPTEPGPDAVSLHMNRETVQQLKDLGYSNQQITNFNITDIRNIIANKIAAPPATVSPEAPATPEAKPATAPEAKTEPEGAEVSPHIEFSKIGGIERYTPAARAASNQVAGHATMMGEHYDESTRLQQAGHYDEARAHVDAAKAHEDAYHQQLSALTSAGRATPEDLTAANDASFRATQLSDKAHSMSAGLPGIVGAEISPRIETTKGPTPEIRTEGPAWDRMHSAIIDGKKVGSVGYKLDPEGEAQMYGQFVKPDQRGQGIAQQLVRSAITEARDAGAIRFVSDSTGVSPEAARVWEALKAKGLPVENITHPNGKPGYQIDFEKPAEISPRLEANISVSDPELIGASHGQTDFTITAKNSEGQLIGYVNYSEFDGVPHINMIEVAPNARRQGFGTALIQAVQKEYPNTHIDWGMTTPEGTALRESITPPEPQFEQTLARRGQLPNQKVNLSEAYGDTGKYVGGLVESRVTPEQYHANLGTTTGPEHLPTPPDLLGEGQTPHSVVTHEDGHTAEWVKQGLPVDERMQQESHLAYDAHGAAGASFMPFDLISGAIVHDDGSVFFPKTVLQDNWSKFLRVYLGGGMAEEAAHGVRYEKNAGTHSDLQAVYRIGKSIGLSPSEVGSQINDTLNQMRSEEYGHPAYQEALRNASAEREEGLPKHLLASHTHTIAKANAIKEAYNEWRNTAGLGAEHSRVGETVQPGRAGSAAETHFGAEGGGAEVEPRAEVRKIGAEVTPEELQNIDKKLVDRFGTTEDPLSTGFILPDGRRVDPDMEHDMALGFAIGRGDGGNPESADAIYNGSVTSHQMATAIYDNILGQKVKDAGHDAIVGYYKKPGGGHQLSEIFDLTAETFPEKSVPKGATTSLQEHPLAIEGTGHGGKTTLIDLAGALNQWAQHGMKPGKEIKAALDRADAEIQYQLARDNTGLDWYKSDTKDAINTLKKNGFPELEKPLNDKLFRILWGITSYGVDPDMNITSAAEAWKQYQKKGSVPLTADAKTNWPGYSGIQGSITLLNKLLDEKGEQGAVNWLTSKHPVSEIREQKLKTHETHRVAGKATDEQYGAMIFGPKGGAYVLNHLGIADQTTVDIWGARLIRRWTGNLTPENIDARVTTEESRQFDSVVRSIADKHNLDTWDAQAVLWTYEHDLYEAHGVGEKAKSYKGAAEKYVERQKEGSTKDFIREQSSLFAERYGKTGQAAKGGRKNAPAGGSVEARPAVRAQELISALGGLQKPGEAAEPEEGDTSFPFGANVLKGLEKPGAASKTPIPKKFKQTKTVADNMSDPDTRFNAARHEAAHAVISEALNPGSVNMTGLTTGGGVTDIQPPAGKQTVGQLSPDEIRNMIATSYAGGLSEPGGTTQLHASGDVAARAQVLAGRGTAAFGQAPELQAEARARVNALLADPAVQQHINTLTSHIAAKGKLSGDEVRAVLKGQSLTPAR